MSKETTNKEKSWRTQLLFSAGTGDKKIADTEKISGKLGFFRDQVADFIIIKVNFPENTLVHANQGNITSVKFDLAVY